MGKVLQVKVTEKGMREDPEYRNTISLHDPNLLALILKDLESMYNAPIRKACKIFLGEQDRTFPFSPN